ncbi:MAG TPA: CooT family nickel-binding protein [Candidatus Anoxymicrobiaceae bacterium]|jgi:predicted RNA-binding protein
MCEAVVFIVKDGESTRLMEDVVTIVPDGDKLLLTDLFGEQKLITARIDTIDLMAHEIILR